MLISEVLMNYCTFDDEKGFVLNEDAPKEAKETFEFWQKGENGEADSNGICTLID